MEKTIGPFSEDDLLSISGLQHLAFCERQWALIHVEGIWAENRLTAEGLILHEKTDQPDLEVRGNVRIARALRLKSINYGLAGVADVVEFHKWDEESGTQNITFSDSKAIHLEGAPGLWQPVPVEYKRGKPKLDICDEVQLCGQALCLEEMLECSIPKGFLYYSLPRKRHDVIFDENLRKSTYKLIVRLHELNELHKTPPAQYEKKCESCSLKEYCLPKVFSKGKSIKAYIAKALQDELD